MTHSARPARLRASRLTVPSALLLVLLVACGGGEPSVPRGAGESDTPTATVGAAPTDRASRPEQRPLRRGETRKTLMLPEPYQPSAPGDVGTDDYRCFLLDPGLESDVYLTGTDVLPGNADLVHHVILFQVPPDQVDRAQTQDDDSPGEGWTCFGGTGFGGPALDDAPWLGAWAPGGAESVARRGYGVRLAAGTRVIVQVHYNLLGGTSGADQTAVSLRLAPLSQQLAEVSTMLLPAPVELPCRPEHKGSPLCSRDAAVAEVKERFGTRTGATADVLHLLCPTSGPPGQVQRCTRTVRRPTTVLGVAGHMHLLGRAISVVANEGTPRERVLLDLKTWDFDDQGARRVAPLRLRAGDQVTVTCRHDQSLRDHDPELAGAPERYVVWGEGTTDEMCLGILQVTFP